MRHTDSNKVLKTAFLLITASFIIGTGSAVTIDSPNGGTVGDPFEVRATDFSTSDVNITVEGSSIDYRDEKRASIDGGNATAEFNVGDTNSGDYEITVEEINSSGAVTDSESVDVSVDSTEPQVTKKNQVQYVGNNPTIKFSVSDDYSAVTDFSASSLTAGIDDGSRTGVCGAGGECTVSLTLDTDSLSNGDTFTVEVNATDLAGNPISGESFSYTLDNSFQADEPSFSVEDNEDGVVALDGDASVSVTVNNVDSEESEVRVKCLVDGEEVDTSEWGGDESFTCEIPEGDVSDENVDVSVEACDRAGNCKSSDEKSITFDGSDPILESFGTVQEYRVFGDDFDVEYEASDSGTGISSAEYFFSTAVLPGEGNEVNVEGDREFKVETSLLSEDSNQHTVYMRVQDEAGRWSDYKSVDFEYYPDADPSVSLSVPENFSVKAGSSKGFDVVVENTGKLMIDSINVSLDSDNLSGSKTVSDLEGGESSSVEFMFRPNESEIGEWTVEVSSTGPVASKTASVLVEANSEQRSLVERKLENYSSRMESLEENVSELRSDGLNEKLNETLNSRVSSFRQTVEAAQRFADQGQYYRAYSALQGIEEEYTEAKGAFSDVRKQHRINERNQTIIMVLMGLAVILIASGAYIYTSEEYALLEDLSDEDYDVPELGGIGARLSEKFSRLKDFLRQEEEEAEEAFQGFS